MLGGCDLVDEAKARVLGSEPTVTESEDEAEIVAVSDAPAHEAPEPMLLGRRGVAGVVEKTVAQSDPTPRSELESIADLGRPAPRSELESIADLGRPAEPKGSSEFVPYDDGTGVIAEAPISEMRPSIRPRPRRPRPTPRIATPVDEPCDPGLASTTVPDREWECLACGRG